jgi:hypothetical protein
MTELNTRLTAKAWWQSAAFRANRWYALGLASAGLLAFSTPYVLGPFVPCAEFMEVEWVMVLFLCLATVGLLNILFSYAPMIEVVFPRLGIAPIRLFVMVAIPVLVVFAAMWLTFEPFWWALLNDPELLCD